MEYIKLNITDEHICCAISSNKDVQVASKKAWLSDRFDDGLVFIKADARGKCFIEYIPASNAFTLTAQRKRRMLLRCGRSRLFFIMAALSLTRYFRRKNF